VRSELVLRNAEAVLFAATGLNKGVARSLFDSVIEGVPKSADGHPAELQKTGSRARSRENQRNECPEG
jgi:hypothetical protein